MFISALKVQAKRRGGGGEDGIGDREEVEEDMEKGEKRKVKGERRETGERVKEKKKNNIQI